MTAAHTYVGGRWRSGGLSGTDLGTLPAAQTAADLLNLAEEAPGGNQELITAASLADSTVIWPRLIALARQTTVPLETRRHAAFWLGQAAGEAAGRDSTRSCTTTRSSSRFAKAVFALSQRPKDEAVPALIRIARSNPDRELRKSAIFWLGQTEDPRALEVFEQLLLH